MIDRWKEQAKFMRDVGAIHAEWATVYDQEAGKLEERLVKLTLGAPPQTVARPAPPAAPPGMQGPRGLSTPIDKRPGTGPAASLARMHDTMFAASRMKPRLPEPPTSSDVPRAVSAKKAAARGAQKAAKRSTRKS